ncbi:MAG: S8 family peptidase [Clostridiales bacterium]|nr:S8 family peptidase [Clostridiales bacterium]
MTSCLYDPASDAYEDFIIQYLHTASEQLDELARTSCIQVIDQNYAVIYANAENIRDLNISDYTYASIPKIYGLLDTGAVETSGILKAVNQPSLLANGRGVLIGFIDTGIDYTNPLFQNTDGTTRILAIWDQTASSDKTPAKTTFTEVSDDFPVVNDTPDSNSFYGMIYSQEEINRALARLHSGDDPFVLVPRQDENGHGTFMASVAAGRDVAPPVAFSGAAPAALIAAVRLKPAKQYLKDYFLIPDGIPAYQENDLMTATAWLVRLAQQHQLPLVICLGIGTSQGSHDGSSPFCEQLNFLTGYPGVAAVTGAGNETGSRHHYHGLTEADSEYDDVQLRIGAENQSFCMELWTREPNLFTVGFVSPSGETIRQIPLALGKNTKIPFRLSKTEISLNYVNYESGSGSQLIFMRFQNATPGIWHLLVYPDIPAAGEFHIWLPMRQFLSEDTFFLKPDPDTIITDPGNAAMPITAAAFSHLSGGIDIHSSRGFTRSGRVKPDFAAPGVDVQGAAKPLSRSLSGQADEIRFTRMTGTSAAAAVTAGAVADLFTWAITDGNDPALSPAAAKSMLIRGATRNPAFTYPNREWGFGKLDLYQTLALL